MKSAVSLCVPAARLPGCVIVLFLLLCISRRTVAAQEDGDKGCEVVRSMGQTFDGPDVGATWGELLLMGIDFADEKRGVIGGFNDPTELLFNHRFQGMVGYTEDGGRTFKFIKTRANIWAVSHGAGDTFWAAGHRNLVMRSDDAGKTWKEIRGSGHSGRSIAQINFRDADHGIIAGGQRKLYVTDGDDAGKRFRTMRPPSPTRDQLPGGKRPNSLNAAAISQEGFGLAGGGDGELIVTTDHGATWHRPPGWVEGGSNKVPNWLRNAEVVGKTHGWMVGDNGTVVRTTDGGKTFELHQIPGGDFLNAVRFADTEHGWILGWHNAYRTEDGGKTWKKQTAAGGVYMNGLSVLDADTAWIAGHYGVVQQTTDGGKTWQTLNDYTDLYAVAMIDDSVGYAGAESGAILKTTDGGRTWAFLNTPRGSAIEALQFLDANTGWAVGDFGHVVFTTDGGASWHTAEIDFSDILKDVHFFDAARGVAVGARGAVFATTTAGASWKRIKTPTSKMLYAVDFPTPTTGYACGSGVVLKTTDGGATWQELKSPTIDILSDIRFTNEARGVMVGDIGRVFLTDDGGATWRKAPAPTREWLHRIEVLDDGTLLVAGSRGIILRSSDAGATWTALKSGVRNNVYCISRNVAVGRWGQVQLIGQLEDIEAALKRVATFPGYENTVLPEGVSNVPTANLSGSFKVDEKGRLTEVSVNGRTYPTNRRFPTFTVLVMKDGKPDTVKEIAPDDKGWKITPEPLASGAPGREQAFIFDSDLLTVRVSYTGLPDRVVVKARLVEEKQGRLLKVSTGDDEFIRLIGDTPETVRKAALAVPVDGGELIPFTGFAADKNVLQKSNGISGWSFKSRMISFSDGSAGIVLRSHQWHAEFHYGQGHSRGNILPTRYLYLGWSFDTRVDSAERIADLVKEGGYGDNLPSWLEQPPKIDTFGFDLQYVGDVNNDGRINWVDSAVSYREGNYKRSRMVDENPALCGDTAQAPTCFMLWDNPLIGNAHIESRAMCRSRDGRPAYQWGSWSRSVGYEFHSGRLARYFDKVADDFDFPPMPNNFGSDTWTCGGGRADFNPNHPATREEAIEGKIEGLQLLARRGYRTDSEAISEWGLAGNMMWGWWGPYLGNGVWPGGFSRCWDHVSTRKGLSGPVISHVFGRPIPMQTALFQGLLYHGAGSRTPPGYAILNGSRPQRSGMGRIRHQEFFYYPWIVLWKMLSPYRLTNATELDGDLWELSYEDGSVLKLDVRANTWVLKKDGITYDGYSPANPHNDPMKSPYGWGTPYENFKPPFAKGSFGVWRNGSFTIRVAGVKAVKPPRVVGAPEKDQAAPQYTANFERGVLTINIKDKDPVAHPMLVFEAEQLVE